MSLNILIVDDDTQARQSMRGLLARCRAGLCDRVEEAADAGRAAGLMRHRRYDLLLLDVRMPGQSGLALAESLRWWDEKPAVVIVTAYPEHALEAFEADAVDYLTKPVRPERLQRALAKAAVLRPAAPDGAPDEQDSLPVVVRGRVQRLPLAEVIYLRAEHKRVTVVATGGHFQMGGTLVELEARYGGQLLRVHRHTLVARHAVLAIRRVDGHGGAAPTWELRLRGSSEVLPVSRRLVTEVRKHLMARA